LRVSTDSMATRWHRFAAMFIGIVIFRELEVSIDRLFPVVFRSAKVIEKRYFRKAKGDTYFPLDDKEANSTSTHLQR